MNGRPYFSIGVTTYDRRELLVKTVLSILGQGFHDFEVIVGNDNPNRPLTSQMLGIDDSRVRILNHSVNLGEIANMNELLAQSRGRYFTWLADDDLYMPDFLQAVRDAHDVFPPPSCVFTGYASGEKYESGRPSYRDSIRRLAGREFLREYLDRKIQAIGCYGVFETRRLQHLGGMQQLGDGFSPYSDNLLVIKAATLGEVIYVGAPLIFFRTHSESVSFSSPDVGAYATAQEDLCARALEVFGAPGMRVDLRHNLYELLSHWCLTFMFHVLKRTNVRPTEFFVRYARFLVRYSRELGLGRFRLLLVAVRLSAEHLIFRGKIRLRRVWGSNSRPVPSGDR